MKKFLLVTLITIMTSTFLVGCNTPDSGITTDGNSNITINVDKTVENVDGFFEGLFHKIMGVQPLE